MSISDKNRLTPLPISVQTVGKLSYFRPQGTSRAGVLILRPRRTDMATKYSMGKKPSNATGKGSTATYATGKKAAPVVAKKGK
jgi:hypothetical protein